MMVPFEHVLAALVWAAGGQAPEDRSSEDLAAGACAIADALCEHRLAGRALAAANRERPYFVTDALLARLAREHEAAHAGFAARMRDLDRFVDAKLRPDEALVMLKGDCCRLWSGSDESVRATADVDAAMRDPEPLLARLRAEGVSDARGVSPHELLSAVVCGVNLDLHAHYPVWSASPEAGHTREGRLPGGMGVTWHEGRLRIAKLAPEDLFEDARPLEDPAIPGVWIPSPAVCALVVCAHATRNLMARASVTVRNKPPLRMVELAELRDFLDHPAFDPKRFAALIDRFEAQAPVAWIGGLLERLFGDRRLVAVAGAPEEPRTMPVAIWGGFFARLAYPLEAHFHRHIGTEAVVDLLGGGSARVPEGEPLVVDLGGPPPAAPVGVHGSSGPDGVTGLACRVAMRPQTLEIDVAVTPATCQPNQRVCLDIGGFVLECNWNRISDVVTSKHSSHPVAPRIDWRRTASGYAVTVTLAREQDPCLWGSRLPVLVGAGEFERDHVMHAGVLVPLMLEGISAEAREP